MKKRKKREVKRNSQKTSVKKFLWIFVIAVILLVIGSFFYVRTYYPAYYQKMLNKITTRKINTLYEEQRIKRIVSEHKNKVLGIDLSHYQSREDIIWDSLYLDDGKITLDFAIFRATMGNDSKDKNFPFFWQKAQNQQLIRGAYHYYRPDEDPILQAESYLSVVNLGKGDFFPILDVEQLPKQKTIEQYLKDIQTWLDIVEKKYGKKPIIYTYISFYQDYLHRKFKRYPLWIANYNNVLTPTQLHSWQMWQFTENGITPGSKVKIDLNIFNGNKQKLKETLLF